MATPAAPSSATSTTAFRGPRPRTSTRWRTASWRLRSRRGTSSAPRTRHSVARRSVGPPSPTDWSAIVRGPYLSDSEIPNGRPSDPAPDMRIIPVDEPREMGEIPPMPRREFFGIVVIQAVALAGGGSVIFGHLSPPAYASVFGPCTLTPNTCGSGTTNTCTPAPPNSCTPNTCSGRNECIGAGANVCSSGNKNTCAESTGGGSNICEGGGASNNCQGQSDGKAANTCGTGAKGQGTNTCQANLGSNECSSTTYANHCNSRNACAEASNGSANNCNPTASNKCNPDISKSNTTFAHTGPTLPV